MSEDTISVAKLEEFLDNLPATPEENEGSKLLWTAWTRLYPEKAKEHTGMARKIETIKLMADPDMDIYRFQKKILEVKKELARAQKEKNIEKMVVVKEVRMAPIKMELVEEVMEVEPLVEDVVVKKRVKSRRTQMLKVKKVAPEQKAVKKVAPEQEAVKKVAPEQKVEKKVASKHKAVKKVASKRKVGTRGGKKKSAQKTTLKKVTAIKKRK